MKISYRKGFALIAKDLYIYNTWSSRFRGRANSTGQRNRGDGISQLGTQSLLEGRRRRTNASGDGSTCGRRKHLPCRGRRGRWPRMPRRELFTGRGLLGDLVASGWATKQCSASWVYPCGESRYSLYTLYPLVSSPNAWPWNQRVLIVKHQRLPTIVRASRWGLLATARQLEMQ